MGVENIQIGACQVKFGDLDLGYTSGGVVVSVQTKTKPSNEVGLPTHYDYLVTDTSVMVECPLVEMKSDALINIFPWAVESGDAVSISDASGKRLRQYAKALVLTPINENDDIIEIPKATPIAEIKSKLANNSERIVVVRFQALCVSNTDVTLIKFYPQP